jgi:hypothetical protein
MGVQENKLRDNSQSASVTIREINNGYEVSMSREVRTLNKDGNNYLYDYLSATFAYDNMNSALDKAAELLVEYKAK